MLGILPFKAPRAAYDAFVECKTYFKELVEVKTKLIQDDLGISEASEEKRGMDLLGKIYRFIQPYHKVWLSHANHLFELDAMIKASAAPTSPEPGVPADGKETFALSTEEIIGNSFIFLLAGHETTANSIHFSLIYLACNPGVQRAMQSDIDRILSGRDVSELDYYKGKRVFISVLL